MYGIKSFFELLIPLFIYSRTFILLSDLLLKILFHLAINKNNKNNCQNKLHHLQNSDVPKNREKFFHS